MRPISKLAILATLVLALAVAIVWLAKPARDGDSGETSASSSDRAHGLGPIPEIQRIRSHTDAWAREQDLPGPAALHGTVVDESDAPVAGATVTVSSNPPRSVVTDDTGSWKLAELLPRPYRLDARKDRSYARLGNVAPSPQAIVLRMSLGAEVRVRVVDAATQAPVAGAHVHIHRDAAPPADTDDAGWASFRGAPPVEAFTLDADKPGYASVRKLVSAGLAGQTATVFRVDLERAATLTGRVVDQSGRNIVNATVAAVPAGKPAMTDPMVDGVHTDAKGRFTIADVAPGTLEVRAFHPDFRAGAVTSVTATAGAPGGEVIITMRRAVSVSGRVVDASGEPAAWAEVQVHPELQSLWNGAAGRHVVADAAGEFRIDGLPPTAVRLIASTSVAASSQAKKLDLAANQDVENVELTVDLHGEIAGTIVDGAGAPVAGAAVTCQPAQAKRVAVRCPGFETSDADGHFRLGGLGAGSYRLLASRGVGLAATAQTIATTGETGVHLALASVATVTGQVRFSDGGVPEGARVELSPGRALSRSVASDGTFSIDQIDPGAYTLLAVGSFVARSQPGVHVAAGQRVDVGVIIVERGRTIEGVVVDDRGVPIEGARVVAGASLSGRDVSENLGVHLDAAVTQTDDAGHFKLVAVPPDAKQVVAEHPRHGRTSSVSPGAGPMRLVLHAEASLEGTVAGIDRANACYVTVQSTAGMRYGTSCDRTGRYRIASIGEGDYHVSVDGPARLAGQSRELSVAAGQSLRLDF